MVIYVPPIIGLLNLERVSYIEHAIQLGIHFWSHTKPQALKHRYPNKIGALVSPATGWLRCLAYPAAVAAR